MSVRKTSSPPAPTPSAGSTGRGRSAPPRDALIPPRLAPGPAPAPPTPAPTPPDATPSYLKNGLVAGGKTTLSTATGLGLEMSRALWGELPTTLMAAGLAVAGAVAETLSPQHPATQVLGTTGHAAAANGLAHPLAQGILRVTGLDAMAERRARREQERAFAREQARAQTRMHDALPHGAGDEDWEPVPTHALSANGQLGA